MNDFVPRIDSNATADRTPVVRVVPAVAPVAASGASGNATGNQDGSGNGSGTENGGEARRQLVASMADYSRIQSRIARILVSMNQGAAATGEAGATLDAMASPSGIVVPLPPTTLDALEMAERTARSLARQAGLSLRAQANLNADTVTQILSADA